MITRFLQRLSLLLVCAIASISAVRADPRPLTVFAASSLKDALDEIGTIYASRGGAVRFSYASTSQLAKQIEHGAPADIFISADLDWMDYLAERSHIDRANIIKPIGNSLILIAPKDSTTKLEIQPGFALKQALQGGKLAMADVKSVPAGKYGKAALISLGVWDSVEASVTQSENVRAALKLVSLGEATLGIVYASDAHADVSVKILGTFPASTHPQIIYPAAPVKSSTHEATSSFLKLLASKEAQTIFLTHGFTALPP